MGLSFMVLVAAVSFAQDKDKEKALQLQKANNYIYEGNELIDSDDYISAEMEYRKAISEQPTTTAGTYNLGNSYYKKVSMMKPYIVIRKLLKTQLLKQKSTKLITILVTSSCKVNNAKKPLKLLKMH